MLELRTLKEKTMHQQSFRGPLLIGVLTLISIPIVAQSQFPQPPQISYGISIGTENAKAVAAAAIAEAQKNHWTMAIAVVDTGAYLVYFERMRDTQTGSVDLAIEKARTSSLFRRPSRVFEDGLAAGGAITFGHYV